MPSITVPLEDELKQRMDRFAWVNWSEAGREAVLKRDIFERFLRTGTIADKDWDFCDAADWHPVDELPLKKAFIKELKKARTERTVTLERVADTFK